MNYGKNYIYDTAGDFVVDKLLIRFRIENRVELKLALLKILFD